MDMDVNTTAFFDATKSLKNHGNIIDNMTAFLIKRFQDVHESFDDVNYDRTMETAEAIKSQTLIFLERVNALEKGLKELEALVNEYTNGGYGR